MPYRPTEKTLARKAQTRQNLVDCALAIVAEQGFGGLAIQLLAERAAIATGAVYKHFDSKAQLCAEVFRIATQKEVDIVRQTAEAEGTQQERLRAAIAVFAQRAIRGKRLAYALIAEPVDAAVDEERLRYRRAYADIFQRLVEEGMEAGLFAPQIASVSAASLVGVISEALVGPLSSTADGQPVVEDAQLVAAIQDLCLRAVGAR